MMPMKKRTVLAVTLGVWIAALGSAAALATDLNRPSHFARPHVATETSQPGAPLAAAPVARPVAAVDPAPEQQPVLVIPTVTIVGSLHPQAGE
jgi:hypothetical protein